MFLLVENPKSGKWGLSMMDITVVARTGATGLDYFISWWAQSWTTVLEQEVPRDGPCPRSLQPAHVGASVSQQGQFEPLFRTGVGRSVEKGITLSKGEGRSRASEHREDITKWSSSMSCHFAFWQPKLRKEKEPFPLMQDRLRAMKPFLLSPISYFLPALTPFATFCIDLVSQTGQPRKLPWSKMCQLRLS